MKKLRNALLLPLALSTIGCEEPVDSSELIGKLTALNERVCACKDVACVEEGEKEHALLSQSVHKVKKDRELTSKFAELNVAHSQCVQKAMAALGHK